MSYYTLYKVGAYCVCVSIFRAKGEKGITSKSKKGQKEEVSVIYWLIHAVFSGMGFLEMLNTMVKFRMPSLPVFLAKQEVMIFVASP